jgi:leucine-rich repeat protein SHOC2
MNTSRKCLSLLTFFCLMLGAEVLAQKKVVNLSRRGLTEIPEELYLNASNIKVLKLYGNRFDSLPSDIVEFKNLEKLYVGKNDLRYLPASIGELKKLKILSLTANKLDSLPEEIGGMESLEQLWLGQNQLKALPPSIGQLKNLKNLYVHYNWLDSIPESIGGCEALEFVNLNRNNLQRIPESLGKIKGLKELHLVNAGFLVDLPETFCDLRMLEVLEIDQRVAIPPCLLVYQTNRLKIIQH